MASIIQHGQFRFEDENIHEIDKEIQLVNKKKAFWAQFCSRSDTNIGDKLTLRRQILLDPTAVARLNEGETPRVDQIKVAIFEVTANSYGSYIPYSRQAYKKNRDSILNMCRRQLAHSRLYDLEAVRSDAFLSSTFTVVAKESGVTWFDYLAGVKVRLKKNGGKPVDGVHFGFITTPEVAVQIAKEAKADGTTLNGTNAGVEVAKNGYIGAWGGFHIYENSGDEMYTSNGASKLVFFAKDEDDQFPVISRFADESNVEVISKEIGSSGDADPTNEHGSIASRIDDIAAGLEHPELCLTSTFVVAKVAKDIPNAYAMGDSGAIVTPVPATEDGD